MFQKKTNQHLQDSAFAQEKIETNIEGFYHINVVVKQIRNLYTQEIVRLYSNWNNYEIDFDVEAYAEFGKFTLKNMV